MRIKTAPLVSCFAIALLYTNVARSQTLDTILFGNSSSESAHGLSTGWDPVTPDNVVEAGTGIYPSDPSSTPPSDVVVGGLGQKARRLLPRTPYADIYGGEMSFTAAVDPARQNYLTVKLWGSDPASSWIWLVLNVEGLELGLRHGGDAAAPDELWGNKQIVTFSPGQWVYRTVALPIHLTRGKTSVSLKIRSMGGVSDYDPGPFFGSWNKMMNSPSLAIYRLYTHLGSQLDTTGEAQGTNYAGLSPRTLESEATVIAGIKSAVNNNLSSCLGKAASSIAVADVRWLAECYDAKENLGESWISYGGGNTSATLVQKVIAAIDYHVGRQSADANYLSSFGNSSWGGGFGPLGEAIRLIWPQINSGKTMATVVAYGGSYGSITRTSAWSKALRASVDAGRYARRGGLWANQDFIGIDNTYRANRGLELVDPSNAINETEAQRYLKETCGLLPWAGSDQSGGGPIPVKGTYPLGQSFYEVTSKGTTKDNSGFVGSDYGEMGSFAVSWGVISGNTDILNRGLQLLRARANFRFPSFDESGYRVMQGANVIGVRNRQLPGHYGYLARGNDGLEAASLGASMIGNDLMGYFQNGVNDGQQLRMMTGSTDPYVIYRWTLAKAQAATGVPVPMAPGAPNFAWTDEENMVVAAKYGENRLYANLYWAAPGHINGWAKVFHLPANAAPELAEVQLDDLRYRPTGTFTTLGPRVEASSGRQPPDCPVGAYNGVVVPLAWRSDLSSIPASNPDSGKGTGYTLRYGHWLVGINAHYSASYDLVLPSNFAAVAASGSLTELVSGSTYTSSTVTIAPKTSAVFYMPDVADPAPRPSRPLTLNAKATTGYVALDWDAAAGATAYHIKRATTSGGPYTNIGTSGASVYRDTTAASGTSYYYVVCGLNGSGLEGGDSPEVSGSLAASGLLNRASGGTALDTYNTTGVEGADKAFDGIYTSGTTKWYSSTTGGAAWLQYDFGQNVTWAVTRYDITSANDVPQRDPKDWQFQGSNDGSTWTTLDTRSAETFSSRGLTKSYSISNSTGYRYYRLNVTAVSGGLAYGVQLAELWLNASSAGTVPVPAAPTGLAATSGNSNVFLQWSAVSTASAYNIKRATSSGGPYTTIGTTDDSFFIDSSAPSSGTYYYEVTSVNAGGESSPTSPVSVAYGPSAPVAPTGLVLSCGPNVGNVTLQWDASPGVPTYNIKRSTTSGTGYTSVASGISDLSFIDSGRSNGITYYYVVSASVAGVESANSAEASIMPQTFQWSGTTANWSVGGNWGGTVPGNGSLLIFSGSPAVLSSTNNLANLSIGGLVFNSGAAAFTLSGSALVLGGNIADYATATQTVNNGFTLSGDRTIDVEAGALSINGPITDGANSCSLTKIGAGLLALKGSNSFDGGLYVYAGTVGFGASAGTCANLGAGPVTVGPSGILRVGYSISSNTNLTTTPNSITFAGGAIYADDAFQHLSGTLNVTAASMLGSTYNAGTNASGERDKGLFLDGVVSGNGDLTLDQSRFSSGNVYNTSIVHFTNGSNTYSGQISLNPMLGTGGGNYLGISASNALQYATVNLDNGNTMGSAQCFGASPIVFKTGLGVARIGALSGAADLVLTGYDEINHVYGSDPVTLIVGGNGGDSSYSGAISGLGGITKSGSGTFTLGGDNSYAGTTTVTAGTLELESALSGGGNVVVSGSGTLAGDASVSGTLVVNSGGTVAPGGSGYGTLVAPALSLGGGGTLAFSLGASSTSDQIAISGSAYAVSGTTKLSFTPLKGFGPGTYALIVGAPGISASSFMIGTPPPAGYSFALAATGGALSLTVTGPPPAPTVLVANAINNAVALSWEASPGATGYRVYRSITSGTGYSLVGTTGSTAYTNTGLTNGATYYFVLTGSNGYGESAFSNEASATPEPNTWAASPSSLNWSLASNWGGAAPLNNALLAFGNSSATNLNNDLVGLAVGGFLFNSGASAFTISGNSITLTGNITNNSTSAQTSNLQMTLVGSRTVTANTGAITLNGSIDDGGLGYGLVKNGTGNLILRGTNTFSGGMKVNAGTVTISGDGTPTSGPVGGGLLTLGGCTIQHDANTTLYNDIYAVPGTISYFNEVSTGNTLGLYGSLTGSGTLATNASANYGGTLLYGDNSNFAGTFIFNGGNAARNKFASATAGSALARWILNGTADSPSTQFGTGTIDIGELSGNSANIRNDTGGSSVATFSIGALNTDSTFSGVFSNTGIIAITKVGTGKLTFSGNNPYTGATTVSAGTLEVTGGISASPVTVQSGATLSGNGTLGSSVTVSSGGNLIPGVSGSGTMSISNTFNPQAGSNLNFTLGTNSSRMAIGTSYTAPSGGTATVNIAAAAGFAIGNYTLITSGSSTVPISSSQFTVGTVPAGYSCALSATGGVLTATIQYAAPTGLTASPGNGQVTLTWTGVTGATGYNVKRSTTSGTGYTTIASGVTSTTYTNTGLSNGTRYYYVVTAVYPAGESANSTQASAMPALAAPVITSATSATGTNGSAFSYAITASNSPTSYGASGLPAGLSVNTSTGVIGGTPTATGLFNASIRAINLGGTGSATLAITILSAPPVINSAASATGTNGRAFSYTITATNSPSSFGASGLPAGLSVNTSTGVISGTPSVTGTFSATLSASNAGGTGNALLAITVLPAPPASPTGLVATGGNGAVALSWNASSGATSYSVKRSSTSGTGYVTLVSGITGTSYTDTMATNWTTYYYVVSALNAQSESANSAEASATPMPPTTWIGGGADGNWQTPANWTSVPVAGDTLYFSGTIRLSNTNNYAASTTFGGVVFNVGAGAFVLAGNAITLQGDIVNNSTSAQTINLPITLSGMRTVTANTGPVTLTGSIDDAGLGYGLVKSGTGNLILRGTNTFSGGMTVNAGTVTVSGVGSATGGALGSGLLTLGGCSIQHDAATTLYNDIYAVPGTISYFNEVGTGNTLDLYGSLAGSGTLATNASANYGGTRLFGDNSNFAGTFIFNGGNAARNKFASATAGSALSRWVLNGTADSPSTQFGTGTIELGELSGNSANIRNDTGGSTVATFSVGALNTDSTFSGVFTNSGIIAITKVGTGKLTFSGNNTYTGATTVSAGTLCVTGGITASPVTVQSGATLSGSGTLGGSVTVSSGGNLTPGVSGSGTMSISNTFNPQAGSNLNFTLGTNSSRIAIGTSYTAPSGGTATINISPGAGFAIGNYTLIASGSLAGSIDSSSFTVGTVPAGYSCTLSATGGVLTATIQYAIPSGLTAVAGNGQVMLNWTGIDGAIGYNLKRSTTSGTGYTTIATGVTSTRYTDTSLSNGTSYYYVVTAVYSAGESANSPEADAMPVSPSPVVTSSASATGTNGSAFNYAITASNGPTSYGATGLPSGLSVNTTTGVISGTPTVTGTFSAIISASNTGGTGSAALSITVLPTPPSVTSPLSATGTSGSAFSYAILASNSPTSYGATGLPGGLSVNTTTGVISGTPSATGTFGVIISASNAGGTGNATLAITIFPQPPAITSALSVTGTAGAPLSYQITATNSPTNYDATGLPAGLVLNPATGLISGTPAVTGTFGATLIASNVTGSGTATLSITLLSGQPVWTGLGADNNWMTAANWTVLPMPGGTLAFAGATQSTNNNNFAPGTQFGSVLFNSGAGAFTLGGNPIVLSGSIANNSSSTQTINLGIVLAGGNQPIAAAGGNLVLGGLLSGTGGITATGTGLVALAPVSGSNSYSGPTSVGSGMLEFQGPPAMSGSSVLTLGANATLSLRSDTDGTFAPAGFGNLTAGSAYNIKVDALTGAGAGSAFAIMAPAGGGGGSSPTTLNVSSTTGATLSFATALQTNSNSGSAFATSANNIFNLNGANVVLNGLGMGSNGDGGIVVNSTTGNSLTLNGNVATNTNRTTNATVNSGALVLKNTQSGGGTNWGFFVTMNGGSLCLNAPAAINSSAGGGAGNNSLTLTSGTLDNTSGAALTVTTNPTIKLNGSFAFSTGTSTSANDLNLGSGAVYLATNSTLTTNGAATLSLGGAISSGTTFSLTKAGTGTLRLSGSSSFAGTTTVSGGTLNLNGSLGGSLTMGGGATLTGTGSIAGPVNVSGTVAPGNGGVGASGTLSVTGAITFNDGAALSIGLGATGISGQVVSASTVSATGTTLVNLTALAGFAGAGTYPIVVSGGSINVGSFSVGASPVGYGCVLSATGGTLYANIVSAPIITSALSATGTNGSAFSYAIAATNSPTSYGASGLPADLSLNTNTGVISGIPSVTGTFNVTISASNAGGTGSATLTITILPTPPAITSASSATGISGSAFSYAITATNSPTSYGASGLPAGLSLNASTGVISGIPSATGTFSAIISASNAGGTGSATLTITVLPTPPAITSALSATGTNASAFSYAITATNSPTSYGASGLPTGLSVNASTGVISGVPSVTGTYSAIISASNAGGTGNATLTITVLPTPPAITSPLSVTGTNGSAFSYAITATNSPASFDASGLPSGLSVNASTGVISGTPSATGTFSATISASNAGGADSAALRLVIVDGVAPSAPAALTAVTGSSQVVLSWSPASGATAYNVKRSLTSGTGYATVLTVSGTSATDTTAANGTLYYYVVTGTNGAGESAASSQVGVLPGSLPSPWQTLNIGSVGGAIGGANRSGTTYQLAGSGSDIWGTADTFRYAYQSSGTAGTITARVVALANTNTAAKFGVMIRESLAANSTYAGVYITPSSGAKAEYRSATGATAVSLKNTTGIVPPYWVRVTRSGSTFAFYISSNGSKWTSMGTTTINMASSVYIGLPVCSHSSGVLTTGSIDNLTVSP